MRHSPVIRGKTLSWLPRSLQPAPFSSSAQSFTRNFTRHSGVSQPLRSTVIKHPLSRGELGTCTCRLHPCSRGTCAPRGRPARPAWAHAHLPLSHRGASVTDGAIILVFPPEGPRCSRDRSVVVRHIIRYVSGQCGGLAEEGWRLEPSRAFPTNPRGAVTSKDPRSWRQDD